MENASKALLIGGGILIAILILGMGVYLFATYSQLGESYEQVLTTNEIIKFNSNFNRFEGRKDVTAQEIVTLQNFVDDYNNKTETIISTIKILGTSRNITNVDSNEKAKFIEEYSYNDKERIYFKCSNIEEDDITGIIKLITFEIVK